MERFFHCKALCNIYCIFVSICYMAFKMGFFLTGNKTYELGCTKI